MQTVRKRLFSVAAFLLLIFMAILAGGAALRESITIDETAHIGAGVSYLQRFDLRLNDEHPPLPKMVASLPLVVRGVHADYSHISWTISEKFFPAYLGQWVFGEYLLTKWNDPKETLVWARAPMLLLTLMLGWIVYVYARHLGGNWAGLLCLCAFVTAPAFLTFAPLVHTDIAVTLFALLTVWRLADLWQLPSKKNMLLFALCLAGALLSKFTAGILLFVIGAFSLSTRWFPLPGQPAEKSESNAWRRFRWRLALRGVLWAGLFVYIFYFAFSVRQPSNSLYLLGQNPFSIVLRRLLLPAWLYVRGVFLVLITSSRPTFLLGHNYPHGVWFYYPVIFILKSSLGFLGLLLVALVLAIAQRRRVDEKQELPQSASSDASELKFRWRAIVVSLLVFLAFCLLSRLAISIRHFSIPLILLTLLLAAIPSSLEPLRHSSPLLGRITKVAIALLVLSCFVTAVRAYPFFFPYVNPLGFGRPAYTLVNDSNLDWNQSLPEVEKWVEQRHMQHLLLDYYGLSDPKTIVPQAELWSCQHPKPSDAGQWIVISADMIMDGHNCIWLMQFPHEPIAGGSMFATHLPEAIPLPGIPGGPPLPSEYREIAGGPVDMRVYFLDYLHHPEKLSEAMEEMQKNFREARKKDSQPAPPKAN